MEMELAGEPDPPALAACAPSPELDVGIFRRLREDHAVLALLIERVLESPEGSPVRSELGPLIRSEWLSYAKAVDEVFHRALRERTETRVSDLLRVADATHATIDALIERLNENQPPAPGWTAVFEELARVVERHVAWVERELLSYARARLTDDRVAVLSADFDRVKARELQRLGA